MTIQSIPGGFDLVGPNVHSIVPSDISSSQINATGEAVIFVGRITTSDGGSHTIDTTGSSSIGWRADGVTFTNPSTSFSVGVAPVDNTAGPPGRASNTTNVIDFDVKAVFAGGGGGVTAGWQTTVPTTGSKVIADGDLVAVAFQMTNRAGVDDILVSHMAAAQNVSRPGVTGFTASYSNRFGLPNCVIRFADGAYGYFEGGDVVSTITTRTWNSGSATKEYGQLYQLPYPVKVRGVYGFAAIGADTDIVLYSDPLGTPVAEKTASILRRSLTVASGSFFYERFSSPYSVAANQPIGAVFKPGASSISTYLKTLGAATHRIADPWGLTGYGINRASGAFANENSSLAHYYIGLLVTGADDATGGGGGGASRFSAAFF